eukprot:NODE_29_length_2197_cov_1964.676443_g25_i0.p3 GENE.NODE_29_length_2197_cov_1964.676443_g25_i0~~NODE_29_length_2197_cov_1964.676443_g25_i0.p3  ORF type:complete len:56 (-),score=2.65 NODE_29_length_2197_cov_1964.676443_g25_i0:1115-1282(-)
MPECSSMGYQGSDQSTSLCWPSMIVLDKRAKEYRWNGGCLFGAVVSSLEASVQRN